jgi:WhiB family transcriptional regulator, redox-sensing transcriptional regulator
VAYVDQPARPVRLALVAEVGDTDAAWELEARCRGADGSLFFGPHGFEPKRQRAEREAAAKQLCAICPVVQACRDHALRHQELYGVWGGLGEAERRQLLEQRGGIAQAG